MSTRILIIEDELAIREMISFVLESNGYQPLEAGSFDIAEKYLVDPMPSLILLDWMLPGRSGIEIAKIIKSRPQTQNIPFIMVSAKGEEEDKLKGLYLGADDYMTKPFSPKELVARVKAVLRRTSPMAVEEVVKINGLVLNPASQRVTAPEGDIQLGPTEFKLLHFFMTHQDRVFSRDQLLDKIWGSNVFIEDRTVDVHILRLRKALGVHAALVQTVRGFGYRFTNKS